MHKAGKVWGKTELLLANHSVEFHRIETIKGGVCSKHKHEHKCNGFFVESGRMLIRVWKDYGLKNTLSQVDETILETGDFTQVKPGEYHQFEALEDTVAFELYWTEVLNHNDIVRETVGYIDQTIKGDNVIIGNLTETMAPTNTMSTTSSDNIAIGKKPPWHENAPSKFGEWHSEWHNITGEV